MLLHLKHVNHSSDLFYLLLLLLSKPKSNRSCLLSSQKLRKNNMKKGIIFGSILLFIILCGVALWYFFPKAIKISDKSDLIVVSTPVRDSLISSPLSISGRARGTWFFELIFLTRFLFLIDRKNP